MMRDWFDFSFATSAKDPVAASRSIKTSSQCTALSQKAVCQTELLAIETHPIQYHVPVYRQVEQTFGVSVTVVYGSDFSIAGYHDREFGSDFAWDTDLLSGYSPIFLARCGEGGARNDREMKTSGLEEALARL